MDRTKRLQVWGGVECTVNRVQHEYFDQIERSGHDRRIGDLERFASLGISKLRVGFIWERYDKCGSWVWADKCVRELKTLGIEIVAGLVHHGSGPANTSLLDPLFPCKLAVYASNFARRYPEVTYYTPVNEPMTTARFSGLYGFWYPHHECDTSFLRALVNQMKCVVLAMRAIRSVQPSAQLVQTEDFGETWSTDALYSVKIFREHRRWLSIDMLCGRVDHQHPLFAYLRANGLTEADILWFKDNSCHPDIIGLNYYVTSDRFLDHRLALYPGRRTVERLYPQVGHRYVDVEAVRVRPEGIAGVDAAIRHTWNRYHIPIAVTEAHLGGSPWQQVRWLEEIWTACQRSREEGVDVVAVCTWALLGSFD